jgi:hypothetical protein
VLNQVCLPVILTPTRKRGIQQCLEGYVGHRADQICQRCAKRSEGPQYFLSFINAAVVTDGDGDYRYAIRRGEQSGRDLSLGWMDPDGHQGAAQIHKRRAVGP